MKTRTGRPRGRPRKPQTTRLIAALIAKQDAMSRRTARKINDLLATHVLAESVDLLRRHERRRARRCIERVMAAAAPRIATLTDPDAVERLLEEEIHALLLELADGAMEVEPLPPLPPDEPQARVCRSETLAEARGQHARLQARLIGLKERIVPYAGWARLRGNQHTNDEENAR
jgi:hypothetical protein